jgi:hypothetical protein
VEKTIDKSQKVWYYIIKEREKNRNQKEVPQTETQVGGCSK